MNRAQARRAIWNAVAAYMSATMIEELYPQYHDMPDGADARRVEAAYAHVMHECWRKADTGRT